MTIAYAKLEIGAYEWDSHCKEMKSLPTDHFLRLKVIQRIY
ncbi:hypothetical protein BH18THE1_BH18THE1_13120 [soil metagenome]